jgi:hypothetical protein
MLLPSCRGGGLVARERAIRPQGAADDRAFPDPRLLPMHAIEALGGNGRFRVVPGDRLVVLLSIRGLAGTRDRVPVLPAALLQHFVCHHFQLLPSTRALCPMPDICSYNHRSGRLASPKPDKTQKVQSQCGGARAFFIVLSLQKVSEAAHCRRPCCRPAPIAGAAGSPKTRQKSCPHVRIVD